MENRELTSYYNATMENMIADILKSTAKNPKETAFLLRAQRSVRQLAKRRTAHEQAGRHIPAFLISSITASCNLFCAGCYARANGMCGERSEREELSPDAWESIFRQGAALGIPFHLLAGGEPLLRREVLQRAARVKEVIFPVFTNGTLMDAFYLELFDKHRNLVPVLSIEGSREQTDARRGADTYQTLLSAMEALNKRKILFGASITVTAENLEQAASKAFLDLLQGFGCRLSVFVEYVPVEPSTRPLALTEETRAALETRLSALKTQYQTMLFLSFPGDETLLGGCLAAGRGFFHIGPDGSAEPCPFSPYSDRNLKTHTLLEALSSPLFERLRQENLVGVPHDGGCALFEREEAVKAICRELSPPKSKTSKTAPCGSD